jgi:hypothetical protein
MGTTLYVLRRSPDRIPSSIFRSSDLNMDIVFLEPAASLVPSAVNGLVIESELAVVEGSHSTIIFDDLIDKIFSSEHIIVV